MYCVDSRNTRVARTWFRVVHVVGATELCMLVAAGEMISIVFLLLGMFSLFFGSDLSFFSLYVAKNSDDERAACPPVPILI